MVELLIGKKGTGKTKTLIEHVNKCSSSCKGYVVFNQQGLREACMI